MRRIYSIVISILLFASLQGQIPRYPNYVAPTPPVAGYGDEYQAVYDAMTTPPSASIADEQNTLVEGLVDAGIWAKLDLFYVLAQETNTGGEALLNWIDPDGDDNCTVGGSPTWTSLEGYTGASSAWLKTNYNPSSEATDFAQNSASIGVYLRNNEHGYQIAQYGRTQIRTFSTNFIGKANGASSSTILSENHSGFYIVSREGASVERFYRNGSQLLDGTVSSGAIIDDTVYLLGLNGTGGADPDAFSASQIAVAFLGGALTSSEVSSMNTLVEVYMDSNGKGIE